jgi:putative ABC transport system ATP-binding protein
MESWADAAPEGTSLTMDNGPPSRRKSFARDRPVSGAEAIRLVSVSKSYRTKAGAVPALREASLGFPRGAMTALMGPSGSGKSTLLQCAAGLDRPTSGEVFLGTTELTGLDERDLDRVRRGQIGFVFQAYNLLPMLSVYENLALPLRLAGRKPRRSEVVQVLRQVGLDGLARRLPAELSGGQQQRVAIARSLITQPEVLFADEPTGALDTATGRQILGLLRAAVDEHGQSVVLVTHDLAAAAWADQVIFLVDGQVRGHLEHPTAEQIAVQLDQGERR